MKITIDAADTADDLMRTATALRAMAIAMALPPSTAPAEVKVTAALAAKPATPQKTDPPEDELGPEIPSPPPQKKRGRPPGAKNKPRPNGAVVP
jgi:hypothetical protein